MIFFEQPTIKKSVLLTVILDKATELLNSKTLTLFCIDLQNFIDSLKLTNYIQPKDIFILQRHPNWIELFKRDGKGDLVFVTSFKETETTPKLGVLSSEIILRHSFGNIDETIDFIKNGNAGDIKLTTLKSPSDNGSIIDLHCCVCKNNDTIKGQGNPTYFAFDLVHNGNDLFIVLCGKCQQKNNAKNNDVKPIEKTPIIETTTPILELKPKKQIAIKPSELPPVKAILKNNSKSINDTYAGGKNASGVYQFLINHVPPVKCIVSGFLGHCALLKNIKPANLMVGIDKDVLVTDRWNKENTSVKLITGDFLLNLVWVNPKQFGETLVFLDPPYLNETRANQGKLYNHEFETLEQHKTLLEKAIKFPCYVMITAYENELYNQYLDGKNGFTKHYFNGQTRGGRKQECMYINYEVPTKLHDYKYYGTDYRERWNNKKLIDRTISQLKDMPPLRRNMVIDAILNQQF
jgi:hypothetical protein